VRIEKSKSAMLRPFSRLVVERSLYRGGGNNNRRTRTIDRRAAAAAEMGAPLGIAYRTIASFQIRKARLNRRRGIWTPDAESSQLNLEEGDSEDAMAGRHSIMSRTDGARTAAERLGL
jgi:hypothetical protein